MATALWLAPCVLLTAVTVTHADTTDDYVHSQMAKKKIPGLSVAVIRDGHVVKEAAYGKASLELNVPATLDTSYPLASMTKIFTAAAVMQLVQEERISLYEPVMRFNSGGAQDAAPKPRRAYRFASMNAASCDFDTAPTLVATTSPFLNSMSVGMPRTWYRAGTDWFSSMLIFATLKRPA
jgi:CubicO group peptidase (beta-lactamase class C family)